RVQVNQFTVSRDGKATIAGSVENLGAAAADFTVVFELVDKAGAVVGTTTVSAPGVEPKASRDFSAQATGAAPVAWRYSIR
ncbi:MAG: hypothetical protein C0497_12780, partial [Gemmatimonas sp.]|nr:hypothetical protein [Gemmatimonas sp.]